TILMAAMLVGALITVPIWLSISNKQKNNKKMGLIAGFVMFVSFLPMFFMTEIIGMSLCLILFGAGLGGQWFMNPPMMGDVLDDIALRTGNRKQSIYYGYQAFFIRLGGIFQGVIFAIVHILTNFVEGAESLEELQLLSSTPELAVLGIRIHATLIPALVVLITTLLFWKFYDLTPEKVETNREKLKELGI
ncbi:MAG: MFS transporter, partial [archaeon]|nr:MFS transporter [archaeon]